MCLECCWAENGRKWAVQRKLWAVGLEETRRWAAGLVKEASGGPSGPAGWAVAGGQCIRRLNGVEEMLVQIATVDQKVYLDPKN